MDMPQRKIPKEVLVQFSTLRSAARQPSPQGTFLDTQRFLQRGYINSQHQQAQLQNDAFSVGTRWSCADYLGHLPQAGEGKQFPL
jgi:hypothetical protein